MTKTTLNYRIGDPAMMLIIVHSPTVSFWLLTSNFNINIIYFDFFVNLLHGLSRDFYKIMVTKPGLEQISNDTLRVRSNFRPTKIKIQMRQSARRDLNLVETASPKKSARVFADADEIIKNFTGSSS